MKKNYKYIFFVTITIILSKSAQAQIEPVFSQFYASSVYLNPAICGLEHRFAVTGIHRTQWAGINPYISNHLAVIIPIHDKGENANHRGGLAANFINSRTGVKDKNGLDAVVSVNSFYVSGAYNLNIAATTAQNLTFGLQAGFTQKIFQTNEYLWGSQYNSVTSGHDGSKVGGYSNDAPIIKIYPDINVGLMYYYNAGRNIYAPGISFYFGTAFSHLNRPNESLLPDQNSRALFMWKLHSGLEIHVARMLNVSPNVIYMRQGPNELVALGANFTYLIPDHDEYLKPTRIVFGASYRFGDAVVAQVGFGSKYYSIGFSYDFYTSALRSFDNKPGNAFEISFKTILELGKKSRKTSKFHTPLM